MKIRKLPLHKKGFHILFFGLGLLLFSWPIISITGRQSTGVFFAYLFSAWIAIIILLYLIGRHVRSTDKHRNEDRNPSGKDHV